jgi:hypothetical protein
MRKAVSAGFGSLAAMALAAAVAGLLTAQAPETAIRVATRLLEINVAVRDKNGPVVGLTKDDFAVFDQGKRQQVAFFSATAGSAARSRPRRRTSSPIGSKSGPSYRLPLASSCWTASTHPPRTRFMAAHGLRAF